MVELNPIEQLIIQVLKELGATKDTTIKTADDIAKKANRPKGMVNNALVSLLQKNVVKRIAREKAAGYYLLQAV